VSRVDWRKRHNTKKNTKTPKKTKTPADRPVLTFD
jgi:hypothetical protein